MERSLLNIRKIQKLNSLDIRAETKVIDFLSHALKLKWQWAGHIARLTDDRWTKKVTTWTGPKGKRKRGRPKSKWSDDNCRIAGTDWVKKAETRILESSGGGLYP
ncbi:jg7064 [Pararge aegeria aegeria]|uniref:Jg7064 protein n=1 Tax=Pararge aegeria aegeria TaxID=348720 RepID=A0A8S4RGG0_9NEOP|nr:jg7064 [Pararge aegeria aegeria]